MVNNYDIIEELYPIFPSLDYDPIIPPNTTFDFIPHIKNPPEEIPKLIDKINEGYDVVYGTPDKEQHGFLRNLASITTKVALKKVMEVESARYASTFRIFRTKLRDAFKHFNSSFVIIKLLNITQ